jgi:hypothetical protein
MSIRTTVSLDQDVLDHVRAESRTRGASFRETLNDLLRLALLTRSQKPDRGAFRVRPSRIGLRPGLAYDDVEALIEYGEGGPHR